MRERVEIRSPSLEDVETLERSLPLARPGQHRECISQHDKGRVSYLIAWREATPVGHGLVRWSGPRDSEIARRLPECPEIFMLGVAEHLRSRGIGCQLLAALEALAAARGAPRVGLGVALENRRARRLYTRTGYCAVDAPLYIDRWSYVDAAGKTRHEQDRCEFLAKRLPAYDSAEPGDVEPG